MPPMSPALRLLSVLASGLLLACGARGGGPSTLAVPLPEEPPAEPEQPRVEDAGHDGYELATESSAAGSFTAAGADEQIVLRLYQGLERGGPSEEAMEQGFVTTPKLAEVVLLDAEGRRKGAWVVAEWEDGWEWGSSVDIEGTLASGATGRHVLVLRHSSYGEGPGLDSKSARLVIMEVDDAGGWSELWSAQANQIEVVILDDRMELELTDSRGWDDTSDEELTDTRSLVVTYGAGGIEESEVAADDPG